MKAILEFNLPEDNDDHKMALAAPRMLRALEELREAFRSHRKYDAQAVTEDVFFSILTDNTIDLETIYI